MNFLELYSDYILYMFRIGKLFIFRRRFYCTCSLWHVDRQSIKKPNFLNSEPASARSTLAIVAFCSGDFKLYSDPSSITPCQLIIELDALE